MGGVGCGGAVCGGGASFECPQDRLRQAQGERTWEARVQWGAGDAMGDGDAPRRAPLDSCLGRSYARGGVRVVMRGLLVAEGPSTGSGRTDSRGACATGSGGRDGGFGGGAPRRAPLDTGFRRYDDGGVRGGGGCWWRRSEVPLRRDGRFANRPYDGEWGTRWGFRWGCAAPRPSEYRLSPVRRWGVRGGGGCWWWGVRWRTETPRAAPLWIPAFAGMTLVGEWGMRWGGGGRRGWGLGA